MVEKTYYPQYPHCNSCKHFETFVNAEGRSVGTVCVLRAPTLHPQVVGMGKDGNSIWSAYSGWPSVLPTQRCGEHEPAEQIKN